MFRSSKNDAPNLRSRPGVAVRHAANEERPSLAASFCRWTACISAPFGPGSMRNSDRCALLIRLRRRRGTASRCPRIDDSRFLCVPCTARQSRAGSSLGSAPDLDGDGAHVARRVTGGGRPSQQILHRHLCVCRTGGGCIPDNDEVVTSVHRHDSD